VSGRDPIVGRPTVEKLHIPGPVGVLEAVVEEPVGFDGKHAAILCHPHPLHAGTMNNKVVSTVARALRVQGHATVRFNFRGVGASSGEFDGGFGETHDALAVFDWAVTRWPGATIAAAGFSFGAFVAFSAASQRPVERLITVAPPIERFDFASGPLPVCRWLVIQGDNDELVDAVGVVHWAQQCVPSPHMALLAGAGHYFHGRLNDLMSIIRDDFADAP